MKKSDSLFDIIIVGGGIVGLTLAYGLVHTNKKIALLDAKDLTKLDIDATGKDRFSAINRTSQQFFEQLGVWTRIEALGVSRFKAMYVWDAQGGGAIHFNSDMIAARQMGYIIQNRKIQCTLLELLKLANNVEIISPVTVTNLMDGALTLEDGRVLHADLIIGADGGHSTVRTLAGIEQYNWSYQQTALIATVHTEQSHQQTAWQCFLSAGPLAFLPLADTHECSIVWSTAPNYAKELLAMPEAQFNKALTEAFESRLGSVKRLSKLTHFPLTLRHAKNYTKGSIVLVGDAAHTIHPLAGQGINLGLKDVKQLLKVLKHAIRENKSPGSVRTLRAYERARKGDNWMMIGAMEFFKRLFSDAPPMVASLRSAGLNATDKLGFLKACLMK